MSNASHRHSHRQAREIHWVPFVFVVALVLALLGAVTLMAFLAPPASASTSYLKPAVTAARALDR
jgi:hypothetical protein